MCIKGIMEKKNHIPRPPASNSQKLDWDVVKRRLFEEELVRFGWVKSQVRGEKFLGRQMPDEGRFVKGDKALFVDDNGCFAYEYGHRIGGISNEEIDASDQDYLCFNYGRRLDLKSGKWVI